MRKFFIVVFLFITGCSVVEEVEINSEQPQVQSADYRVVHDRKQLISPASDYNSTIFLEDGILFDVGRAEPGTQEGSIDSSLLMFQSFDSNTATVINADPSTLCTFDNYQKCSGKMDTGENIYYYNNALYTVSLEVDYDNDQQYYQVYQNDLSLNNKRLVYTLNLKSNKEEGTPVPSFIFHNNQMIITSSNTVLTVNMETWKELILFEQSQANVRVGHIWNNKLYVTVRNFLNEEGLLHKSSFIEIDLISNNYQPVYTEITASKEDSGFILRNDEYIVYYDEDQNMKALELETMSEFDLGKFGYIYWNQSFSNDMFAYFEYSEDSRFVLMDFKGNELSSIPSEEGETWGEYLDDEGYFYRAISQPNSYKLMRHKIENKKFGKAEVLIEVGEQEK